MDKRQDELRKKLETDPGSPVFVEYAGALWSDGDHQQALHVVLTGLSHNPACHRGRLLLARMFYEFGFTPFAIREVEELVKSIPASRALRRLLQHLSPGASGEASSPPESPAATEQVLAEAEFDVGELDLMEEEEGK